MITNYGELKSAVQEWADKTASWPGVPRIPDFIQRATAKINRDIRIQEMEQRWYLMTVGGQERYPVPPDLLEFRNLVSQSSPSVRLEAMTPSQMDRKYTSGQTQRPLYYTVEANELRLAPAPSGEYRIDGTYYKKLADFVLDADTNAVLQAHPFLYLHGALAELYRYAKDLPMMQDSEQQYMTIGIEIDLLDKQKSFSGASMGSPYHVGSI